MNRTWIRRGAVATAVAAALALAAPAHAAGWESRVPGVDLVHAVRQWLAGLWPAPGGGPEPASSGEAGEKAGCSVNPNGQPLCEPTSSTTASPNSNG